MTRIFWASLALVPLVLAGSASAQYHRSADGTLLCAQCHVMHFSQGHGYQPGGGGNFVALGGGGPHTYLLRNHINDLCLSCHDGVTWAPDVLEVNSDTNIRAGGGLNRTGANGYFMADGHTLDSNAVAPGGTWQAQDDTPHETGLNCINCHLQHGRNYTVGTAPNYTVNEPTWRNLRWSLGSASTSAPLTYVKTGAPTYPSTKDILWNTNAIGTYGDYDERVMELLEPNATTSKFAQWCGACHTNFHGAPGDAAVGGVQTTPTPPAGPYWTEFERHPVSGVDVGDAGGGHSRLSQYLARTNRVKTMSEGDWYDPAGTTDTNVTPTCISCHKGHGNKNAFGLIYRSGGGTLTEEGDSLGTQLEALCGQCHSQGNFYSKT